MNLQMVTLGVALGDVSHEVRETGGNNEGPRVAWYLRNAGIVVPAPWCAAAVQGWSDIAAQALGVLNPLDSVVREALVLDYYVWAAAGGMIVEPEFAKVGDLVFFDFHPGSGRAWDQMGIVLERPGTGGGFRSIEGNTSDANQRDGDAVAIKGRRVGGSYPVAFARWGA